MITEKISNLLAIVILFFTDTSLASHRRFGYYTYWHT